MAKKSTASSSQLKADAKYDSRLVAKFVNCLMHDGKKSIAFKVFYDAMDIIASKIKDTEPLEVFEKAIENVKPQLEVRSKRVGGSTYQVPVSGFAEHADYLELSCSDLVGAMLTDLVTGEESIEVIDSSDCDSVAAAMLAVNMRNPQVQCDFQVLLESDSPPIWVDQVVYSETFDANPGQSWERSNQGVNDGYQSRDWKWRNQLPGNGLGGAFFAIDSPTLGDCNVQGDDQSGVMHLSSPVITLPAYSNGIVLVFDHYVATEAELDGGNLKLSVNGGPFRLVEAAAFMFNRYNNTIRDWNTSNPLAGEPGFTGKDEGQVLGTWGQSQVDLGGLAAPGDTIRIRFDFGTNRCRGDDGWYVDNLKILATADPVHSAGRRIRP